ncbi:Hypothetical_protein [Hexamita inflata]|uniref:Hypothetical_protein n=1 Tax=Hexamita inflata TaxID=28002 RepID=A0AA86QBI0_9EUKA|nr:Hypothetical protein HINF_LOCUS43430 [Hexamita inflata]
MQEPDNIFVQALTIYLKASVSFKRGKPIIDEDTILQTIVKMLDMCNTRIKQNEQKYQKQINDLNEFNQQSAVSFCTLKQNIADELEKTKIELQEQISLKNEISNKYHVFEEQLKEKQNYSLKYQDLTIELQNKERLVKSLQIEVEDKKTREEEINNQYDKIYQEKELLEVQIQNIQSQFTEIINQRDNAKAEKENIKQEYLSTVKDFEAIKPLVAIYKTQLKEVKLEDSQQVQLINNQLISLNKQISELESLNAQKTSQVQELESHSIRLIQQVEFMRQQALPRVVSVCLVSNVSTVLNSKNILIYL